jgi:hypothetical protein
MPASKLSELSGRSRERPAASPGAPRRPLARAADGGGLASLWDSGSDVGGRSPRDVAAQPGRRGPHVGRRLRGALRPLSPDGQRLSVSPPRTEVAPFLRDIASAGAVPISGTEDAWQPSFSPDGHGLVFFAERKLKKVSLSGPAVALAEIEGNPRGASWERMAGSWSPSQYEGLSLVDVNGSAPKPLTQLDLARAKAPTAGLRPSRVVRPVHRSSDHPMTTLAWRSCLRHRERRQVEDGGACGCYRVAASSSSLWAGSSRFRSTFRTAVRGTPEVVLGHHHDRRNGAMYPAYRTVGRWSTALRPRAARILPGLDRCRWNLTRIENTPGNSRNQVSALTAAVSPRASARMQSDLWIVDTRSATPLRLSGCLRTANLDSRRAGDHGRGGGEGPPKPLTFSATGRAP